MKKKVKKKIKRTSDVRSSSRWSDRVTRESDSLDLQKGVFKLKKPQAIAESLARSAEKSSRKKTSAFQAAMSMLNFYINRAGKNLSHSRRQVLEKAKSELRKIYGHAETKHKRAA
jgi:hypothetical protein